MHHSSRLIYLVILWGLISVVRGVVGATLHHPSSASLSSGGYRLASRRDLKKGKKGKGSKKSSGSSSDEAANATIAPSTSSPAPTYASSKSKKKKKDKSKKKKSKKGGKGGKGGKKSKKGEDDSLEPTVSPETSNSTAAATSAPSILLVAPDPPDMDANSTDVTTPDVTAAPSAAISSKTGKGKGGKKSKKSKKSKKGGKGGSKKGKGKGNSDKGERNPPAPKTKATDAPGAVPATGVDPPPPTDATDSPPPLDADSPPPADTVTTSPVATTTRSKNKPFGKADSTLSPSPTIAAVRPPRVPSKHPSKDRTKRPKKSKSDSKSATPSVAPSITADARPTRKPRQRRETNSPTATFPPTVEGSVNGSSIISPNDATLTRVDVSPFQIAYTIVGTTDLATEEQIVEAVEISLTFVHDYFALSFELLNELTQYNSLEGARTASPGASVIAYSASARFGVESTVVPTANDLDNLLTSAFQQPSVETLLIMLRNLPVDNPYSKTTSVAYQTVADRAVDDEETTGFGGSVMIGVASALLTACVVTCAAAVYRRGTCHGVCRPRYVKAPGAPETDKPNSTSGSSRASRSTKDEDIDDSYRSRIIEEDVEEVQFFHPSDQESESSKVDPLFQASPSMSVRKGRNRSKK